MRFALIFCIFMASFSFAKAQEINNSICVLAFEDVNRNGVRDPEEGPFVGINVTVTTPDGVIVANHVTTDTTSPHCFESLPPATYQLTFEDSANHQATTQNSAPITLDASQRVRVEFGAVTMEAIPEPAPDESGELETTERLLLAALGALIAMAFMMGLGLMIGSLRLGA